ncbi:uncharacterized protein LOC134190720 isoform X2 [Corticium candelabrum]|uniref:uncharacterized protein LOC134190720 isoform X2 n=1 Tax=Corticium candelabrum TaxID=121492 RepID=UPI002E27032C|nr:uncharacterized protein LOC134190720 isoform X2 [Corticium candelabrum]
MAESSEDLEKRWLAQATYLSDFALINAIYTSPECSTFVARCLLRNFPWPERTYLLKLEAAGSQVRNEANLSVLQEEASIFVDLDTARTAKLLAQFEDTVGHFLMPHSECSGHIRTVCYVWQHHLSVKSIRSRLPVPLPCCLAIKWTIDTLEGVSALTGKGVLNLSLKTENVGVDRNCRLVISPAAVEERLFLQHRGDRMDFVTSENEEAAALNRKVNRAVAVFCSQLIWGHRPTVEGRENMADRRRRGRTSRDLDQELLLPWEYPTDVLELLMSCTSTKSITLEEALVKLRSLEETLERNGGVVTLRGADVRQLTALLTSATQNQIGALRRRERQLTDERDAAIKSLEEETSKQKDLVDEIELLAKEKHAISNEKEEMGRKLKKLKHRRNVYAKKFREAASGKPEKVDLSRDKQAKRHSRNLEKCEELLVKHDLALQELQRLADEHVKEDNCLIAEEHVTDPSGVDSETSGDSALPTSVGDYAGQTQSEHLKGLVTFSDDLGDCDSSVSDRRCHLSNAEFGVFRALRNYQSFMTDRFAVTGGQDPDRESVILNKTETASCDALPVQRLQKKKHQIRESILPLGFPTGWWKNDIYGQTVVTAHELDSQKLLELCVELMDASCTIQQLEVGWTDLREDGCIHLAQALKKNASLIGISLHHCEINPEGAAVLSAALDRCLCLRTLRLNWNNVGNEGVTHFVPLLKRNNQVTNLELCWNNIDSQGAECLAAALTGNCSLTSLDLSNNHIGPEGACRIAEALRQNSSLIELSLKGNGIGGEGARAILRAVRQQQHLQCINLSYNGFGDGTASVLANVLLDNKCGLTEIDISGNEIESPGVCQLALGLKANKTLTYLSLAENNIDDAGGIELAAVLRGGCHLKAIVISSNQLSVEVAGLLKDTERQQNVTIKLCEDQRAEFSDDCVV